MNAQSSPSVRVRIQRFGTALSNMVMPAIGAFIAWGFITALFIPDGPLPNETLAALVGPMITYLLPLLIGFMGGYNVYSIRGGVVGAAATMGVIVGVDVPMFIGAMIMGPLTAWLMKKLDKMWAHAIPAGFEMLVNNFSAGIFAAIMAVIGLLGIGPVVGAFSSVMASGVQTLVDNNVLPLTSILIEPAKILFLNNAINHGIITPLGTEQALVNGKSVLFMLEANPGPGLGILLAWMVFGRKGSMARSSAPGAAIIHFFGGIHEIYFPYVLMQPLLILACIAGGMTGVFLNVLLGVGLRAPAAPGSIIAVLIQTPDKFAVVIAILGAAAVSMLVAAPIIRASRTDDLESATAQMEGLKGKESAVAGHLGLNQGGTLTKPVAKVVFACDAGMGSSAMGASVLRKMVHQAGHTEVEVVNKAVADLRDDWDIVVVHQDLADRAKPLVPSAVMVTVDNFMNSPAYPQVVEMITKANAAPAPNQGALATDTPVTPGGSAPISSPEPASTHGDAPVALASLIAPEMVRFNVDLASRRDGIAQVGQLLLDAGAVDQAYVDSMFAREDEISTAMGNGLAIPHGLGQARKGVYRTALAVIRTTNPVEWGGQMVDTIIGIASQGDEHLAILGRIAEIFANDDLSAAFKEANTYEALVTVLEDEH